MSPNEGATRALLVCRVSLEADDVISIELTEPDGRELPAWEPGAHIDLFTPSGRIRQYSLCGDPQDRARWRIAVLREDRSRGGSRELHDHPLVGRKLRVIGPRNHFPLVDAERYLFLAGGIGVTPILPMLAAAERAGRPWSLVYGGRRLSSMAFRSEIARRRGGSVRLVPQDTDGLPDLEAALSEAPPGTAVYCCGPEPMLQAAGAACLGHLGAAAFHLERFSEPAGPLPEATAVAGERFATFEVELARSGRVLTVPADKSLLRTVKEAVPTVLYSCEEGYCGTCETRVLGGLPDHRDSILSAAEQATNTTMMICVGRSLSERLVLDL
ncbi:MAG TPA: PDR/VanB family oxidoreductase [Acidimicrobiales bacterium]|nr:PDR/VanB family oxidoreductase [Acidimicrobiales bacterium]